MRLAVGPKVYQFSQASRPGRAPNDKSPYRRTAQMTSTGNQTLVRMNWDTLQSRGRAIRTRANDLFRRSRSRRISFLR